MTASIEAEATYSKMNGVGIETDGLPTGFLVMKRSNQWMKAHRLLL